MDVSSWTDHLRWVGYHTLFPPACAPVWHFTTGHDDALAILLAGYHGNVQLLGVSTVASNQVGEACLLAELRLRRSCCHTKSDLVTGIGAAHACTYVHSASACMMEIWMILRHRKWAQSYNTPAVPPMLVSCRLWRRLPGMQLMCSTG